MLGKTKKRVALVTGSAGFIGFHISKQLLSEGWKLIGLDCLSNYYDVSLKKDRERILLQNSNYLSIHKKVEETGVLKEIFEIEKPEVVIHLAAQAGVRYSIENPRSYLESNIIGTFELLEAARLQPPQHMLLASTSSIYGASVEMPYQEKLKADQQMSIYAATKKSTENISHSYSHLFNLPITMLRFFTVYGPWGRPDMALFRFTEAILNGKPIDVYNFGKMARDFTYIDDIVEGMRLLIDVIPKIGKNMYHSTTEGLDVAPFRVVNIGNSKAEKLTNFIEELEKSLGRKAIKNFVPMQMGDVPSTYADSRLLEELTGYHPKTTIENGVKNFVKWYIEYHRVKTGYGDNCD